MGYFRTSVDAVVTFTYSTLEHWVRAQDRNVTPAAAFLTEADGSDKWVKPVGEVIKINVDATLFSEAGTYSFACVARDSLGNELEAISSCREGVLNPEMVEGMGVREALSWVKRKPWRSVVIETDSLSVVQSVRSSLSMMSYFDSIISDCKDLLQELPGVSLLFIRRSANRVAHYLARASYYVVDRIIRSENIPPEFLDVIMNDY